MKDGPVARLGQRTARAAAVDQDPPPPPPQASSPPTHTRTVTWVHTPPHSVGQTARALICHPPRAPPRPVSMRAPFVSCGRVRQPAHTQPLPGVAAVLVGGGEGGGLDHRGPRPFHSSPGTLPSPQPHCWMCRLGRDAGGVAASRRPPAPAIMAIGCCTDNAPAGGGCAWQRRPQRAPRQRARWPFPRRTGRACHHPPIMG